MKGEERKEAEMRRPPTSEELESRGGQGHALPRRMEVLCKDCL